MSRKSIILIIVATLILIGISVTTVYKEPEIKNIYVSDQNTIPVPAATNPRFSSDSINNLYLLIESENLKPEHTLEVVWEKYEDEKYAPVQQDTINPESEGSGIITITMIKRNGTLPPGRYKVSVSLSGKPPLTTEFKIE